MENKSLQKIIDIIRFLHEEGEGGAPTNSLAGGKIAGTVEAGDNPPVRKKNKYIYGAGFRKNWLQKRNPPQ
jgi:hypothetical protein